MARILLIAGDGQHERETSFKTAILESQPGCSVIVDQTGKFDRKRAYDLAIANFSSQINNNDSFQVVFCTADSMTLGCRDALEKLRNSKSGFQLPILIGYDGIKAVRDCCMDEHSPVEAVVVQSTHSISIAAVNKLNDFLETRGSVNGDSEITLPPELYPVDHSSRRDITNEAVANIF